MFKLKTKYNNYLEQLNHMTDDIGNHFAGYHIMLGISSKGKVVFEQTRQNVKSLVDSTQNPRYCKHLNYYMTLNTFKCHGGRHENNVRGLNAVWADIDCKTCHMQLTDLVYAINKIISMAGLPIPTAINNTGHGLHIIWLFTYQVIVHSPKILNRWYPLEQSINSRLDNAFNQLVNPGKHLPDYLQDQFTDPRCQDVTRVLRMPNTWNVKDEPVHCYTMQFSGYSYDMDSLCNEYITKEDIYDYYGWSLDSWKRRFDHKLVNRKIRKNHQKRFKGVSTYQRSLYTRRNKDLYTLITLRNHENIIKGYREQCIFLTAVNDVQMNENALLVSEDVSELNEHFKQPLNADELENVVNQVRRGGLDSFDHISDNYYIKSLNISTNEQKSLKILISGEESRRRHNLSRNKSNRLRSRKFGAKYKRRNLISTVKKLRKHGLSIRNIAKKLNISRSSVSRYSQGD